MLVLFQTLGMQECVVSLSEALSCRRIPKRQGIGPMLMVVSKNTSLLLGIAFHSDVRLIC